MFGPKSKAAAAIVALAHIAAVAAQAACTREYTVIAGDTCDGISAKQNVSTFQLAAVNPDIDAECANLQIGQVLCLGREGEDCTTTYVVQPLDTCDGISQFAGVNNTILYTNNPQINQDCTNIYIGEVLCIAGGTAVPATGGPFAPEAPPSAPPTDGGSNPPPAEAPANPAPAPGDGGDGNGGGDGGDEPYCDSLTRRDLEEYDWYY